MSTPDRKTESHTHHALNSRVTELFRTCCGLRMLSSTRFSASMLGQRLMHKAFLMMLAWPVSCPTRKREVRRARVGVGVGVGVREFQIQCGWKVMSTLAVRSKCRSSLLYSPPLCPSPPHSCSLTLIMPGDGRGYGARDSTLLARAGAAEAISH